MALRELEVVLKANIAQYEAKLGAAAARTRAFGAEVGGSLQSIERTAVQAGKGISTALDPATALRSQNAKRWSLAATAGLALFLRGAVTESREAFRMARQTDAVIRSTGGIANVSAGHVDALAQKLSKVSAIDDEVVQSAENVLLTFTKVRNTVGEGNDIFDQATQAALDMSAAMGTDLQSSVVQLGKALQDPVRGMLALRRIGVAFTKEQQDQVKALVDSGRQLDAQKLILRELTTEFGGSAAAAADPIGKLSVAFKNLEESVGTAIAPALNNIATAAGVLATGFSGLPSGVQTGTVALLGLVATAPLILKVVDATSALKFRLLDVATSGTSAGNALLRVGTAGASIGQLAAGAGIFAAIAAGVNALADATARAQDSAPNVGKLGSALIDLGKTGRVTGELSRQFNGDLGHLFDTIDKGIDQSSFEKFAEFGGHLGPSLKAARKDVDDLDKQLAELFNQNPELAKAAFDVIVKKAHESGVSTRAVNKAFDDYNDALVTTKNRNRAAGDATGGHADKQKHLATETDKVVTAFLKEHDSIKEAQQAVDDFSGALDGILNKFLSVPEANRKSEEAIDGLTASFKENGRSIDATTEKGRANKDAIDEVIRANFDEIDAMAKNGATKGELIAKTNEYRLRLIAQLEQMGFTQAQAEMLTAAYADIPATVSTTFTTQHLFDVLADIQKVKDAVAGVRSELGLAPLGESTLGLVAGRARLQGVRNAAFGALFTDRANGHEAEIAPAGAMRVWAEPETQGEAYIPLANDSRRPRAQRIWAETGARLGVDPTALALAGGATQHALGSISRGTISVDLDAPEVQAALAKMAQAAQSMASSGGPAGGAPANPSGAAAIGQRMAAARGWTGNEWNALYQLWQHESGWRSNADNPSSSAYGIPQALPGSKMAAAGGDWRSNPATQIRWGLDYIAGRYGSPSRAWGAWNAHSPHWYAKGGIVDWKALEALDKAGFDAEQYKKDQYEVQQNLEELAGTGASPQQLKAIRKAMHREAKAASKALAKLTSQGFDPQGIEHMAKADTAVRDTERRMRALGIAFDKIEPSGFFTTKPRHGESRLKEVTLAEEALIRKNIVSTTESDKILERFQKSAERNLGGSADVFSNVASLRKMSFDRGGYLPPGITMAYNGTGRPERVSHDDRSVHVEVPITVNGGATPETARRLENAGRSIASDIVRALERGRA